MACKRSATSDLNHDNWDNEEEPEEAGTFVTAPQEVLDKRVVKSARRRLPRSGDGTTKSPFGTFTGFKMTAAPTSSASPFSFLTNAKTTESSSATMTSAPTQSAAKSASNGAEKTPANGTNGPSVDQASSEPAQDSKKLKTSDKEDRIFKKSSDYFAKLKGLNESVSQWIKSHVDSNPFCILTPIFRDYERYIKEIEAKHAHENVSGIKAEDEALPEKPLATSSKISASGSFEKTTSNESTTVEKKSSFFDTVTTTASTIWSAKSSANTTVKSEVKSPFGNTTDKRNKSIFGRISNKKNPFLDEFASLPQVSDDADNTKSEKSSGFGSFGQSSAASATFSFGQSTTTGSTASAGFSFGSGKPFSFGSHVVAPQAPETNDNEEKEDQDEPPKPDFKPITEEDAFFEKRCKVFVKKDGNFSDRGVGVLFLKPTPNGKTQLIVRADNSLGNLLLNTLLTTSIPTKRMNKNTVMLVCLPLPDSEPPPTPVLLRVKTAEDADSLIETLDNNKK